MSYTFSLPNSGAQIFLHPVDQHFEKDASADTDQVSPAFEENYWKLSSGLDNNSSVDHFDVNVKFLLSLDEDENFDDLSTEGSSEAEDTLRDSPLSFKSGNSHKVKIFDFFHQNQIKTEIDRIKENTIRSLRNYQMQMQNNFLMMRQYYENMYKAKLAQGVANDHV